MGSSSASASSQPLSPRNPASSYRVYASFCLKQPHFNFNISNWIECYDVSNNTLINVTSIPGLSENHVLKDFAMISVGDSIYIIGGRVCRKERTISANEYVDIDVEVVSTVCCYNVVSNKWSKCAPLNVPRYNFACTAHENKIYVAGGQSRLASAKGVSSAEVYDPLLNQWSPLPNMNRLRYKCIAVTWQGKIYVISGFVGNDDLIAQYIQRCSAEVYDVQRGRWDLAARMWQLDVPPNQIVAIDGQLFSSGDCLTAWKGQIEAYDEETSMWNKVKGSKFNIISSSRSNNVGSHYQEGWNCVRRLYLTMAPIGSCLFFMAGYTQQGESSSNVMSAVHIFDTTTSENAWRSFEPLKIERERELCSHCCVVQVR